MTISLVTSTLDHVKELYENLRQEDRNECLRLGISDVYKAIEFAFNKAIIRRTGLVDGKVAAMWGVAGTPLGLVGIPYLITSTEVLKLNPMTFVKIYKQETQAFNRLFPILENYVDATYTGAIRMLKIAGYAVDDTPYITKDNDTFFKFTLTGDI